MAGVYRDDKPLMTGFQRFVQMWVPRRALRALTRGSEEMLCDKAELSEAEFEAKMQSVRAQYMQVPTLYSSHPQSHLAASGGRDPAAAGGACCRARSPAQPSQPRHVRPSAC